MDDYKFLDLEFLKNLRNDTYSTHPGLISELFQIYFDIFHIKIHELEKSVNAENRLETLKIAHYLKGQSACVGLSYCQEQFIRIEIMTKERKFDSASVIIKELVAKLPKFKNETELYIKSNKG